MAKRKLTLEEEKAIKDYGKQIETLESFAEACRKMPGMYLGSRGTKGYLNMNREIFQNMIDQIMMIGGVANNIIVSYSEIDKISIYQDDGLGIPHGEIVRIFTAHHTSKNYNKKEGDFSAGLHGSGAKGTCACSEFFEVESYQLGVGKKMRFEKGIPVWDKEQDIKNPEIYQGTKITFKVDETVMNECSLPYDIMYTLFTTMVSLTKPGVTMTFNAIPLNGQSTSTIFVNEDGILYELINKTTKPLIKPIIISRYTGEKTIDIAFTYDIDSMNEEDITAFANWSPTIGGTHVKGFTDGVCQFFRNYMNKIYLSNNKKSTLTIVNSDVLTGLKAMLHAKHLYPDMKGQSKEELSNEDMLPFVKEAVIEQLNEWSKANANDLQKVCKYIKEVAEVRVKSEKGKEKIQNAYDTSNITNLPPKFKKPSAKKKKGVKFEFWIVEGDSAGGSAAESRNPFQGILPIKGKIPNAFSTTKEKFFNNEEVKAFFSILETNPGRLFDIQKVIEKAQIEKVILGVDGDVDGAHIATLVLQMCLLYALPLIEHGMLYRSVAPLFGVPQKGGKMIYYTNQIDYINYVQSIFSKANEIKTINGNKIDNKELQFIINTNIDYTYLVDRMANNYSIDPYLLETVALNSDLSFDKLYKVLKSKYKYMDLDKVGNTTRIKGLVNNNIDTIYLNEHFMKELEIVKKCISQNQFNEYNLNGENVSIYKFMSAFNNCKPKVERYKGLGEMNADKLADSTLLPDNRVLVQYTVASAKEEIARIRYLESNKYELVAGQTTTRLGI